VQVVVVQSSGNGQAVTPLVLGITGVVFGLIPILAVPALICGLLGGIFGFLGRSAVKQNPGRRGKGMATTGIVLGFVAVGLAIVGFVIVSNAFNNV
jgi:uncharacterized membrane protein